MQNFNPQFSKIGDILVYNKVIDQNQLEDALAKQKDSNEKLGIVLINLGYINEQDLVSAYSQQMGYKTINKEEILHSDTDVVSLISEEFAKENKVIASKKTESNIIVVMEDPEDLNTLDSIKKITGLIPEILIAGKSDIESCLEILYDKIKKSGEVESAISNISIVRGDDEDNDELDLATEEVSAEDAPFVKLVN